MLFKVVFLQFLYDPSDREVAEQVNLHLAANGLPGWGPRKPPLTIALCADSAVAWGPEKLQQIFNENITQASMGLHLTTEQIISRPQLPEPS